MDLDKQSKKMLNDILTALNQKNNPMGVLLEEYIKIQLEIVVCDTENKKHIKF